MENWGKKINELEIEYKDVAFQPSTYFVTVAIFDSIGVKPYQYNDRQYNFTVYGDKGEMGLINIPHLWRSCNAIYK